MPQYFHEGAVSEQTAPTQTPLTLKLEGTELGREDAKHVIGYIRKIGALVLPPRSLKFLSSGYSIWGALEDPKYDPEDQFPMVSVLDTPTGPDEGRLRQVELEFMGELGMPGALSIRHMDYGDTDKSSLTLEVANTLDRRSLIAYAAARATILVQQVQDAFPDRVDEVNSGTQAS